MKSVIMAMLLAGIFSQPGFSQIEDRFGYLTESQIEAYVQPFGTTLGMAFNSASYHSAALPETFGFSLSFRGLYILIPDDDLTFTPELPGYDVAEPTPTIYGEKEGTAYYGPDGYLIYPPGIDKSAMPMAIPQVAASFMGTEVMFRYLPSIELGDEEDLSMFGFGLRHSVSRYIPLLPVDIAVQFLYNNLEITKVVDVTAYAFNAHVSKSFGVFTAYSGLQYESSTFDLEYTYTGEFSELEDERITTSIDGKNHFRFTIGAGVKLAVIVINADIGVGSQTVLSSGLTFEF